MREATTSEFSQLGAGCCPRCGGEMFQPGPRGGSSRNVECISCGHRFNVTIIGNQLLFAQYIGDRAFGTDWTDYKQTLSPRPLFECAKP
jgi:hypothetical protein